MVRARQSVAWTGVRSTNRRPAGAARGKTPRSVFGESGADARPSHDASLDYYGGVPSDGNCLYWAFGVLWATYGKPVAGADLDAQELAYVQETLQPSAIRYRLALRIQDPEHWAQHFLRILELVRNITLRPRSGVNGPLPVDVDAVAADVDAVTIHLRRLLNADDIGRYAIDVDDLANQPLGVAEAALDPPSDLEDRVADAVRAGRIDAAMLRRMQHIVNTYISMSLRRDTQHAEAFEVELLAEEFGVVIYYYTGRVEHGLLERGADFDNAELTNIMYPSRAVRDALARRDPETAKFARLFGYHIVRLGGEEGAQHFYYGMRRPGHPMGVLPMARPWEQERRPLQSDDPPVGDTAARIAELIRARRDRANGAAAGAGLPGATPAERKQAAMGAELRAAHLAARRRAEQGLHARSSPANPSPTYAAAAPPAPPVAAVRPRDDSPSRHHPLGEPPRSPTPAWGSADGARRGGGYDADAIARAFEEARRSAPQASPQPLPLEEEAEEDLEALLAAAQATTLAEQAEILAAIAATVPDPRVATVQSSAVSQSYDDDFVDAQLVAIEAELREQQQRDHPDAAGPPAPAPPLTQEQEYTEDELRELAEIEAYEARWGYLPDEW